APVITAVRVSDMFASWIVGVRYPHHTAVISEKQVLNCLNDKSSISPVYLGRRTVWRGRSMAVPVRDSLAGLPKTRTEILRQIKKSGELAVDQLAAGIGISLQAARQQLTLLERDGLVGHTERRDGQGRPRYIFTL